MLHASHPWSVHHTPASYRLQHRKTVSAVQVNLWMLLYERGVLLAVRKIFDWPLVNRKAWRGVRL